MVMANYQKKEEFIESLANVNAVLAAFTTSHSRLTLYSYLEKLNDRMLYFDTDSVIFLTRPGDTYIPATGDYLGDMTDKLPGSTIKEFVSCGPK
uniref:DNA-directed DNA polymerase n=1 Tax=Plectus sambesii TaxID=2011161 RepID=A0A914VY67_9BILA